MTASFETRVCRDAAALARSVAERIRDFSREARARFTIALSGGSTPKRLYETLAAAPFRDEVQWDRLELFFGDERAVPSDHPDSNYGMVRRALLDHVAVAAHRMDAQSGDAEGYERLLAERIPEKADGVPVFDLVLLGMGPDGHTASLFPGTAALEERRRFVVMNDVPQAKTRRMTLTYPVFDAARRVWVLAPGADKHAIVARCLAAREEPGAEKMWPVLGVRPREGELVWWLDEASAGTSRAR